MKRSAHTLAATFMLAAFAVAAQPSETGNTSGSGAKSPDTTRPDGAKGGGTTGAGDPMPSGSAKAGKHDKSSTGAKKNTQGKGNSVNESPSKGSSDTPPAGGPSGGAKP